MLINQPLTRRSFTRAACAAVCLPTALKAAETHETFKPRYLLGSSMYGTLALETILPEVQKTKAEAIDIWPRVHGNQREQIEQMGEAAFAKLLDKHAVSLGCLTQYKLGPFNLQKEMEFARRFQCQTIVTGGRGPRGLSGSALKSAVANFIEQLKPHLEVAAENNITVAIENHANNLIESEDSMKWLAELAPSDNLAIAFAPYHLEQDARRLAELIGALGEKIAVFYAWEHGMGCHKKLPKEQELLQMPGRGTLDFKPIMEALVKIKYRGWFEIFMHPVPRGIPILDTATEVTEEINRSRLYVEGCLRDKN